MKRDEKMKNTRSNFQECEEWNAATRVVQKVNPELEVESDWTNGIC